MLVSSKLPSAFWEFLALDQQLDFGVESGVDNDLGFGGGGCPHGNKVEFLIHWVEGFEG